MTEIKIDKNIPLPAKSGHPNAKKYRFEDMEVGDSFLVPLDGKEAIRVQSNVLSAARAYRLVGKRFTTAIVKNGVRIWRIA